MIANYHSIETFSGVDGPGIRYVLFLQGCNMRCKFCHNVDTTSMEVNKTITTDEVVNDYLKYKSFYKNGGITISGGEPLLQMDFIIELFKKLKEYNVHTCIQTQGSLFNKSPKFDELISLTDLFIVDLKGVNDDIAKRICGVSIKKTLSFLEYLESLNKNYMVTYVLIPGINDSNEEIDGLAKILAPLKNMSFTALPYHRLGIEKWEKLNLKYELYDVTQPSKEDVVSFVSKVHEKLKFIRNE